MVRVIPLVKDTSCQKSYSIQYVLVQLLCRMPLNFNYLLLDLHIILKKKLQLHCTSKEICNFQYYYVVEK